MEISQIRYFLEICKTGSMSKAADNLHITHQGISIAIRRLETEFNKNLFYQKSRGIVLTEFGKKFRDKAEIAIAHIDNLYKICVANNNSGKANVTVALTKGFFTKLPTPLQQLFMLPSEDYMVELVHEYSNRCADMVYDGSATFGLTYGECSSTKFNSILLQNVQQVFVVNKSHPFASMDSISVEQLDNVPMLLPDANTCPYKLVYDMFKKHGACLNVAFSCNAPHQAVDIVASNPNVVARSLLSDISETDLKAVTVLKLLDEDFTIPFYLLTKKGRRLSVAEQLFQHMIIDAYHTK